MNSTTQHHNGYHPTTSLFSMIPFEGSLIEDVTLFVNAIDWTEWWIILLGIIEVSWLLVIIVTRKMHNTQIFCFLLSLLGVYMAEVLNNIGRQYWHYFAQANYFDEHGVFMSVLYSLPLLIISIIALINLLLATCDMLIKVKRAELRAQQLKKDK